MPGITLKAMAPHTPGNGFGSGVPRKVVVPIPRRAVAKQAPEPTPPPQSTPRPVVIRRKLERFKQVDHGLPYMQNINQMMTAKKLLRKLAHLLEKARSKFAETDVRVANARAAAHGQLQVAEQAERWVEERADEVELAQQEMALQEEEAVVAGDLAADEVEEAVAAEALAAEGVEEARVANETAEAEEAEAAVAVADAAKERAAAAEAQAVAEAAQTEAEREEVEAEEAIAAQEEAEQALRDAEKLVQYGADPATGRKLKKQEKIEAAADLEAKRKHVLELCSRISDERTQWNQVRLDEAKEELAAADTKKMKDLKKVLVARREKELQKEQSEGVSRAADEAEMARAVAEERQVSFQWKNPDFQFRNPDFLLRNPDFLLKNYDFIIKNTHTGGVEADDAGGGRRAGARGE